MRTILGMTALAFSAGLAAAQDVVVYGGAELEFLHEEFGPGTGTSSYLSGYVEVETRGFYAGLWAQVADDDLMDEVDLYLGYRAETAGGFSYDIGYSRYYYPNDGGDCCGEITLALGMPVGDKLSATLDLAYDPEAELGNAYVGAAFAVTDAVEISANYGVYEVDAAPSEQEWDLGATYYIGEETAVDARWYDGSEYVDGYFGLSLTWDTTLMGG
ncbi:MAG TPA: hypothetical protein PLM52_02715 [Tabrizicola sp.]|nr:hypothetical protein [Tabrizicola sp.]